MKVNLSVAGYMEDWMAASEKALMRAGFSGIVWDKKFNRVVGDYGTKDYIEIDFSLQNDGRVRLEIDTSDRYTLDRYKESVAKEVLKPKTVDTRPVTRASDHITVDPSEDDQMEGFSEVQSIPTDTSYKPIMYRDDDSDEDPLYDDFEDPPPDKKHAFKVPHLPDKKIFYANWFIVLMFLLLPPLGIFLMYRYKKFNLFLRILYTILVILYFMLIWIGFFGVNTGINKESINNWFAGKTQTVTTVEGGQTVIPPTEEEQAAAAAAAEAEAAAEANSPSTLSAISDAIQNFIGAFTGQSE